MGLVFSSIPNDNALMHYGRSKRDGAPKGSGRYPWGSGENPYQHDGGTFAGMVRDLRKDIRNRIPGVWIIRNGILIIGEILKGVLII